MLVMLLHPADMLSINRKKLVKPLFPAIVEQVYNANTSYRYTYTESTKELYL